MVRASIHFLRKIQPFLFHKKIKNNLPLQARHSILSNAGKRSRKMTPATNPSWRPPEKK